MEKRVCQFLKSIALYYEDHANILKSEMNKNKSPWERLYTYYVNATLYTDCVLKCWLNMSMLKEMRHYTGLRDSLFSVTDEMTAVLSGQRIRPDLVCFGVSASVRRRRTDVPSWMWQVEICRTGINVSEGTVTSIFRAENTGRMFLGSQYAYLWNMRTLWRWLWRM